MSVLHVSGIGHWFADGLELEFDVSDSRTSKTSSGLRSILQTKYNRKM